MKVYWRYRCDYGHEWAFFRDENAVERLEDTRCAFGHEAVTLSKQQPVDRVQITLRPAGGIVDPARNHVWGEKRYYVIVSTLDGNTCHVSETTYDWREALALAERLRDLPAAQVWEWFPAAQHTRGALPNDA